MKKYESLLFAYAYNKLNDVYTIRGIESNEMSLDPKKIRYIPEGLINEIRSEYERIKGVKMEELIPTESFSKNSFYAVVDFHGRTFKPEQVTEIMNGKFVNVPIVKEIPKGKPRIFKRFNREKLDK